MPCLVVLALLGRPVWNVPHAHPAQHGCTARPAPFVLAGRVHHAAQEDLQAAKVSGAAGCRQGLTRARSAPAAVEPSARIDLAIQPC